MRHEALESPSPPLRGYLFRRRTDWSSVQPGFAAEAQPPPPPEQTARRRRKGPVPGTPRPASLQNLLPAFIRAIP